MNQITRYLEIKDNHLVQRFKCKQKLDKLWVIFKKIFGTRRAFLTMT